MERNSKKHTNHRRGGRRKERKDTIRRRRWPLVSPRRFFFLVTVEPACRGPGQVTIVRITGKVCHSVLALSLLLLLSSVRAALPSQTVLFLDPPVVLVSFVLTFFFPSESWPLSAFDFRTLPPPCAALFVVWASPPKQKFPHRYESDGGDFSFCLKPFSARSMLHDACCQSCSQPLFLFPFSYPYIFEADQVLQADIFRLLGPAGLPIFARTIVVVSSNKPSRPGNSSASPVWMHRVRALRLPCVCHPSPAVLLPRQRGSPRLRRRRPPPARPRTGRGRRPHCRREDTDGAPRTRRPTCPRGV